MHGVRHSDGFTVKNSGRCTHQWNIYTNRKDSLGSTLRRCRKRNRDFDPTPCKSRWHKFILVSSCFRQRNREREKEKCDCPFSYTVTCKRNSKDSGPQLQRNTHNPARPSEKVLFIFVSCLANGPAGRRNVTSSSYFHLFVANASSLLTKDNVTILSHNMLSSKQHCV